MAKTMCPLRRAIVTGSLTADEDEPELEDPEELERVYRGRVEIVIDGGPMWPEPSRVGRLAQM